VTTEVGKEVELSCHCSNEVELVSIYAWSKQRLGETPIPRDTTTCTGDDCKFISKKGNQENVLILEIRNVQVNDSGSYYCAHIASNVPFQNAATLLVGGKTARKNNLDSAKHYHFVQN